MRQAIEHILERVFENVGGYDAYCEEFVAKADFGDNTVRITFNQDGNVLCVEVESERDHSNIEAELEDNCEVAIEAYLEDYRDSLMTETERIFGSESAYLRYRYGR